MKNNMLVFLPAIVQITLASHYLTVEHDTLKALDPWLKALCVHHMTWFLLISSCHKLTNLVQHQDAAVSILESILIKP